MAGAKCLADVAVALLGLDTLEAAEVSRLLTGLGGTLLEAESNESANLAIARAVNNEAYKVGRARQL